MTYTDDQIKWAVEDGRIGITPFEERFVQPASYDVHLSRFFRRFSPRKRIIDLREPQNNTHLVEVSHCYVVEPGECLLGSTIEHISLPADMVGRIEGKSSLGRVFLIVHATAGFIDPGFTGHVTLEIANLNNRAIVIYPGMPIAQMSFDQMIGNASRPYGEVSGSKYQDQGEAPVESAFWKNFPDKILES